MTPRKVIPATAKPHGHTGPDGRAEYYTLPRAAKVLGVRVGTIRAMIGAGFLPQVASQAVDRDHVDGILFDMIVGELLSPGQRRLLKDKTTVPEWVILKAQRELRHNPNYRPPQWIKAALDIEATMTQMSLFEVFDAAAEGIVTDGIKRAQAKNLLSPSPESET